MSSVQTLLGQSGWICRLRRRHSHAGASGRRSGTALPGANCRARRTCATWL